MKKQLLFIACAVCTLFACKKDNTDPNSQQSIVGKWTLVEGDVNLYVNGAYMSSLKSPRFTAGSTYQFNTDGTIISVDVSTNPTTTFNGNYIVNGNLLTLINGNASATDTIKQVTANTLWLRLPADTSNPANQGYKALVDVYYSR